MDTRNNQLSALLDSPTTTTTKRRNGHTGVEIAWVEAVKHYTYIAATSNGLGMRLWISVLVKSHITWHGKHT